MIGDLSYNYAALALAWLAPREMKPEQALFEAEVLDRKTRKHPKIDANDLLALREQGLTYEEIGNLYSLTKGDAWTRVQKALRSKEVMPLCQEAPLS